MLVAQLNIGLPVAPLTEPALAGFVEALEPVNALADAAPGFVWRLQTADGRRHRDPPVRRRPVAGQHERVDLGRGARRLRLLRPAPGDHGATPRVLRADARSLPGAVVDRGRPDRRGGHRPARAPARPRPDTARLHVPQARSPRPTASRCAATTAGSARPDRPGPRAGRAEELQGCPGADEHSTARTSGPTSPPRRVVHAVRGVGGATALVADAGDVELLLDWKWGYGDGSLDTWTPPTSRSSCSGGARARSRRRPS